VAHLGLQPDQFWELSVREFWLIHKAKFPEKENNSDEPYFDADEEAKLEMMIERERIKDGK